MRSLALVLVATAVLLLAGQRHSDDGTGLPSDDTWSFRGSG